MYFIMYMYASIIYFAVTMKIRDESTENGLQPFFLPDVSPSRNLRLRTLVALQ